MNAKQMKFAEEYVSCRNASKAAILAGYSEKTARVIGCQLRNDPEISNYINQLEQEQLSELGINKRETMIEINKIAKSNVQDFFIYQYTETETDENGNIIEKPIFRLKTPNELTRDQLASVRKIETDKGKVVSYEFWDKTKALSVMLSAFDDVEEKESEALTKEDLNILKQITETLSHV